MQHRRLFEGTSYSGCQADFSVRVGRVRLREEGCTYVVVVREWE